MSPTDSVRLGPQTNITTTGQGLCGMLQGLSKRRTAVALPRRPWANIKMRIDVDDAYRQSGACIAQVMAVGCDLQLTKPIEPATLRRLLDAFQAAPR